MPMHTDIGPFRLDSEVDLLIKAGKRIIAIVPSLIEPRQSGSFFKVVSYSIIFRDKEGESSA